jgi:hypothetical protein
MEDKMNLKGIVNLKLFGPDGELKQEVTKHNLIVNFGRSRIIALLNKAALNGPTWISIGSDTTAATAGQTVMNAELAVGSNTPTHTENAYASKLAVTFASGVGTGSIVDVGRLCESTTDLLARTVLDVGDRVNKGASDSLVVTYTLTYASS